jgi:hypothetical protein
MVSQHVDVTQAVPAGQSRWRLQDTTSSQKKLSTHAPTGARVGLILP